MNKFKRFIANTFFKELLPVCENLILIVGTQPIDDNQLPKTLLHYSPKKEWFYLPFMSGNSILEYLNYQIDADNTKEEIEAFTDFIDATCPVIDTIVNTPNITREIEIL